MQSLNLKYSAFKFALIAAIGVSMAGGPAASAYFSVNNGAEECCGVGVCCCSMVEDEGLYTDEGCECTIDKQPDLPDFPEAIELTSAQNLKLIANSFINKDLSLASGSCQSFENVRYQLVNINSPPLFLINSAFLI